MMCFSPTLLCRFHLLRAQTPSLTTIPCHPNTALRSRAVPKSSSRSGCSDCDFPVPLRNVLTRLKLSRRLTDASMITQSWNVLHKDIRLENKYISLIRELGQNRLPDVAELLFIEMNANGFEPSCSTLSALMLCFADNGLLDHAQAIWDEIINSSFKPNLEVVSGLMDAYGNMGHFNEVDRILHESAARDPELSSDLYTLAIHCFGRSGQLEMMEKTMKEMVPRGFKVSSETGNAYVIYYSMFGSLAEMENACRRLKSSQLLIEKEAIRAVAHAYIHKRRFYQLGEFLRDVGLKRRNSRNLLWNLLLLSYAANFKMKSLQREFLNMLGDRFAPDITTFNIRALAFSRMCMLWDLHLTIEHMKQRNVDPDLVTYGCIVDMYMDKRLGSNLSFALEKMNADCPAYVLTDPIVYEVFGKGDFHLFCEIFLESRDSKEWTYSKLIGIYRRKISRSNQIFWNL